MAERLLRGRLLSFRRKPAGPEDTGAFDYTEDGALLLQDGRIAARGDFAEVQAKAPEAPVTDHRPHLILPGFIDPHIHFPQLQVVASWGAELLDWLENYTFPAEAAYADPAHARAMADPFLDRLLEHGTTTAAVYCSSHACSAEALFSAAERRRMRLIAGKVMMDRNCPEGVRDTAQASYDDSEALIGRWHGRGRLGYAISPRFSVTSTAAQLAAAGALASEHPDCHRQTHISENHAEIAAVKRLFPDARDYLDTYERAGLLGPEMLLGHCLHLETREIARIAETGSRAVFCPTSNLFLGSGLFDRAGLERAGVVTAVATDIGGGTSWSMLDTLAEGYKALALRGERLHPFEAFHWATRGNAEALGLTDRIGTLDEGTEADLVVLDPFATPAMRLRMDRAETLAEELFVLQIMGGRDAVAATYVDGTVVT
ncbi:guanine deaminase [Rhodosalinus halophilus]|uniref:Guanine deaminase n=1 Tax=Rhodosalinus halophilus TaxID=2259333 RepID=A0A365U5Y6_9RHOB|nr:guanine deaminase [Rhodosalinus halophilus]RBI83835.1 guanine deaminase [Rhodosalinus halophilus]